MNSQPNIREQVSQKQTANHSKHFYYYKKKKHSVLDCVFCVRLTFFGWKADTFQTQCSFEPFTLLNCVCAVSSPSEKTSEHQKIKTSRPCSSQPQLTLSTAKYARADKTSRNSAPTKIKNESIPIMPALSSVFN